MDSAQEDSQVDLTGNLTAKQFRQLKCINRACKNGDELRQALEITCSFYGVTYKPDREVCTDCFNKCIEHYKNLEGKWSSGECIFHTDFPSFASHHVIESSSSSEEEEEPRPSTSSDVPDKELVTLMNESIEEWFGNNGDAMIKQVNMSDNFLQKMHDACCSNMYELDKICRDTEYQIYRLRAAIYEPFKPILKYLPPIDLTEQPNLKRVIKDIPNKQYKKKKLDNDNKKDDRVTITLDTYSSPADLPLIGPQEYPPLKEGDWIFANKLDFKQPWSKCKIKSVINQDYMSVLFPEEKILTTKEIAYYNPNSVQFKVGARVIAMSNKTPNIFISNSFYSGVIGERPNLINKFRYLIFFDDGYVEYRSHKDIRLIVHKTVKEVWNDVGNELKEFLQNYLEKYPERQMVKLNVEDSIRAQFKNRWVVAKVIKVDASLVKLYFTDFKVYEWLYRGSLRLYKMFEKESKSEKGIRLRQSGLAYLNKPIIEYTRLEESESKGVARKSTTMKCSTSAKSDQFQKDKSNNSDLSKITMLSLPNSILQSKKFVNHDCNNMCIEWTGYDYNKTKRINMLAIPLHFGFCRGLVYFSGTQKCVVYKTPCGRLIRNMKEMFEYLSVTDSKMTIDLFDFHTWVNPYAEFRVLKSKKFLNDISSGQEFRGITCVNDINFQIPPPMEYMTARRAMPGVNLNLDSGFLCGCDCTDNCQDKSKCACWKMTVEGQNILNIHKDPNVGYNHRRLYERVLTGIYECNITCKCSSSCLNRVVQFPLSQKLQLFLTKKKGWGVRCLNDIPQGSFICIYVGYLLTETDANEGGINYGDEYLAELDFIEVVEKVKEDYESDVPLSDQEYSESNESSAMTETSDEDYHSTSEGKSATSDISQRLRKRKPSINDTKTKKDSVTSKFNTCSIKINPGPIKSLREYYGKNESVYIMDAKTNGNIGRYLNHSCSPNTFVQNVFVDTQDMRFPWISFFALHYISAGTELTWDYSYDVGSVPGKQLKCQCDSLHCRGRLL